MFRQRFNALDSEHELSSTSNNCGPWLVLSESALVRTGQDALLRLFRFKADLLPNFNYLPILAMLQSLCQRICNMAMNQGVYPGYNVR